MMDKDDKWDFTPIHYSSEDLALLSTRETTVKAISEMFDFPLSEYSKQAWRDVLAWIDGYVQIQEPKQETWHDREPLL